jgi:hypothetical protein
MFSYLSWEIRVNPHADAKKRTDRNSTVQATSNPGAVLLVFNLELVFARRPTTAR